MRNLTAIMTHPRIQVPPNSNPWQATELVFIHSSPGLKVGPNPRVLKRRNNYYMRPRSPLSPTISRLGPVSQSSGSLAARVKNDYLATDSKISNFLIGTCYRENPNISSFSVSELEVERFQVLSSFRGKKCVPSTLIYGLRRQFSLTS